MREEQVQVHIRIAQEWVRPDELRRLRMTKTIFTNLSSMTDNTETYELWQIHQSQYFINYDQNEDPRTRGVSTETWWDTKGLIVVVRRKLSTSRQVKTLRLGRLRVE
jgi:hypothetical protein